MSQPIIRSWKPLALGTVRLGGELEDRARRNWERLTHPAFRAPNVFENMDRYDWPGDWVARTLHGHVLLARTLGYGPEAAAEIMGLIPDHVNEAGYFGDLVDTDALNEQQIGSPLGWLLRALLEYHAWTGDERALAVRDDVVKGIAVPLAEWWDSYPLVRDAGERAEALAADSDFFASQFVGMRTWQSGRWRLSGDVGNQFMSLDGLTEAWIADPTPELKATIDAGIERFLAMDLLETHAQTHATLTTLCAILRLHGHTGDQYLLDAAIDRYRLYRSHGMTENYANANFFTSSEVVTEPCAIIDSFIAALELWRRTDDPSYLEDAHLIWYNGVGRGQRGNGGYGSDSCAGLNGPIVRIRALYEDFFCCTQRGGEGHSQLARATFHVRDGEIAFTFFGDVRTEIDLGDGRLVVQESSGYPVDGTVRIETIESDIARPVTWRFFVPSWLESPRLTLDGRNLPTERVNGFLVTTFQPRAGEVLELSAELAIWSREPLDLTPLDGYRAYHRGPLLLGAPTPEEITLPAEFDLVPAEAGAAVVAGTGIRLARIDDTIYYPPSHEVMNGILADYGANSAALIEELDGLPRQVLFRRA